MKRLRPMLVALLAPLLAVGIYFLAAGDWNIPPVWGIVIVLWLFAFGGALVLDRGLIRERVAPGPGNRDRLTRPVTLLLILAHWVISGIDVGRAHWSPVPLAVQWFGVAGYAAALAGVLWAAWANPFYSCAVRIQADRGHRTVTRGPYRFVRHPGYTFTGLGMITAGLALGSWVGMLPLLAVAALFVRRTLVEDRMLHGELSGYTDYARRVKYRLVAGVF